MRVLVVDDELVSRKKMRKIVHNFCECTDVENGGKAIEEFKAALEAKKRFDAITLDFEMPDQSGLDVLLKIREIEKELNIPDNEQVKVLMVTSRADKQTVVSCIKATCNGYILKPFNKESVYQKFEAFGFKL